MNESAMILSAFENRHANKSSHWAE